MPEPASIWLIGTAIIALPFRHRQERIKAAIH
ncbi:PEP-CTERM sorting domain-containing protein [Salmonella sp. SAL4438]